MKGRFDNQYFAADLLNDILSRGQSSRLYNQLVKDKEIFTSVSSFTMGSLDPGMLVISGRLKDGISPEAAEQEVDKVVKVLVDEGPKSDELQKVKNQAQTTLEFEKVEVINRAMNLAFAALSGDPDLVNRESKKIEGVSREEIMRAATEILDEKNASVLYYYAESLN
jgi:zinc protease